MTSAARPDDGDRSKHFPAIVAKHGGPIERWLERLAELGDAKYQRQFDFLREEHGFSRTHANALVMYARGSTSSKRFATPEAWFAATEPVPSATARRILDAARKGHPDLDLVIAWNHPMLRAPGGAYVIGVSVASQHLLINPFSAEVLHALADRLSAYECNKYTVRVPLDWKVDTRLLRAMVDARLAEIAT